MNAEARPPGQTPAGSPSGDAAPSSDSNSNPNPTPTQSAPRRRGRGCLYGCLGFGGFALILILVVGIGATAYLQRRYQEWEERTPWVQVLKDLAELQSELPVDEAGTDPDEPSEVDRVRTMGGGERRDGRDDPGMFPADVPLFPEAESETFSVGDGHAAAVLEVREAAENVWEFYESRMRESGWNLLQSRRGEAIWSMVWERQGRSCQLDVIPSKSLTEVWIRCRR